MLCLPTEARYPVRNRWWEKTGSLMKKLGRIQFSNQMPMTMLDIPQKLAKARGRVKLYLARLAAARLGLL